MTVSVEGAELFYTKRGRGPTCLVLSSIGTRPYERQMPAQIDDHLQLVFVDLRGSGRSTGEPGQLTFDVLAADLEAVRMDLGLERIAVLGHSILGILAIEYSRRCPASVSHVIAVGTPPFGDMARLSARATSFFEQDASDERKQLLRDNLAALPPGLPRTQAVFAYTPMRFFDPRFDAPPLFADAEVNPQFLVHAMGTLAPAWDITVGSSALAVPLLVALGRHDYVVPHVLWHDVIPTLPRATVHLFEQSGHQPFVEEPDRFTAVLTDWMARQG
jgi:proline iminopeptidase